MYTSYWIEYRLWGLNPCGYHVTNLLLDGLAAVLMWRLLVRLRVPGAWFAAALFAVHPVEAESVAWITERKNVLSLSLALASLLCYTRYVPPDAAEHEQEQRGNRRWYVAALVLFALALFAKTVVVTLPAVILVIRWWQNGRITRRDWIDVARMFVLSAVLGFVTVYMEVYHLGTQGQDFALSPAERLLFSGRALWFYAGKLVWPQPLVLFYPRWTIDENAVWQYLYPISALGLLVALWLQRMRLGRGPLAVALIYAGVLGPMLGFFFNFYFTIYSYVADHFQYHASVALFALVGTGSARLMGPRGMGTKAIACLLVIGGLAALSFRHSLNFHDLETLYRDTLAKNPRCADCLFQPR